MTLYPRTIILHVGFERPFYSSSKPQHRTVFKYTHFEEHFWKDLSQLVLMEGRDKDFFFLSVFQLTHIIVNMGHEPPNILCHIFELQEFPHILEVIWPLAKAPSKGLVLLGSQATPSLCYYCSGAMNQPLLLIDELSQLKVKMKSSNSKAFKDLWMPFMSCYTRHILFFSNQLTWTFIFEKTSVNL